MRNKHRPLQKNLSELERQILEVLWSQEPANADQVREALAPKRALKDSTIRTVLRRLGQKGYVRFKVEGRTYVYSAVEKPGNVAVRAVSQIIEKFCKGSVEELLTAMVENEVLKRDELRDLARKIARHRPSKEESWSPT
jgi:predicted transcriptional regulator